MLPGVKDADRYCERRSIPEPKKHKPILLRSVFD